jgi:CheY-like chemotaxis protein
VDIVNIQNKIIYSYTVNKRTLPRSRTMTDDPHPPDAITVLHVDVYPPFVELAREFLERTGPAFRIRPVGSRSGAIAAVDDGDVDCVVSGYELPDGDGLALLEDVRAVDPELPFVLLTALREDDLEREALGRGATAFLRKDATPEQFEDLATVIATAVGTTPQRDAPAPTPAAPDAPPRQT